MTVRVRFAPSPTGMLHIGNARSAIMNALFAEKNSGYSILRFDDTDQERSLPVYIDGIKKDLEWLGLHYQETFHQSHRVERYKEVMQSLIKDGYLYPCYETPEELTFKRKRQLAAHQPPIYDRAALRLTQEEKSKLESEGHKPHWRFKLEDKTMSWDDMVKGNLTYQAGSLSDPVLVRADGAFLYTLTSVIDDIDFDITHIIRGEDHITNTAVQLQIWDAIAKTQGPTWAHMPLLMDENGKPLSKRIGSLGLTNLREQGVEPGTIISWITRLGTSSAFEAFPNVKEAAQGFSMEDYGVASPRLDEKDMWQLNHKIIASMTFEEVKPKLPEGANPELWNMVCPHLKKVDEFASWANWAPATIKDEDKALIEKALELLPSNWGADTWSNWTQTLKSETGRSGARLFKPLRLAITGHEHGPEMPSWLAYQGRDEVYKRLKETALHNKS